jgi:hypothetical protein
MPLSMKGIRIRARGRLKGGRFRGGTVRKVIQWTLVPVAVMAVACGKSSSRTSTAMTDDLKRDLQLASHTRDIQISPDEVSPKSHQELAMRPKKAPNGPKVIRSEHPTVKASAKAVDVAEIKPEIPQVQVMASAPAPSETPSDGAPPLARPSPVPTQGYPGAQPIPASNGGSILGGIFGAVIRGGMIGDDDHCDPRPARRGGGRPIGGDIYRPNGTGGMIGTGMGDSRFPIFMGGRPR